MPSGKGKKCPNCGEPTFQKDGKIYKCSKCRHWGWTTKAAPRPGGGKGAYCHICEKNTLYNVARKTRESSEVPVHHCKGCGTTLFFLMRKRVRPTAERS
jgi:hypothetical protein